MNWKRIWLTVILVFVAAIVTSAIINGGILRGAYKPLQDSGILRTTSDYTRFIWVELITSIVYSFFFVFIFAKGYESKGLAEGIRYGFYVGLFYNYVMSFNMFVWFPIPYGLAWQWTLLGIIQTIILGIVAAAAYKPKAQSVAA